MAPTKFVSKQLGANENNVNGILGHGITTRSKQLAMLKGYKDNSKLPHKRKADSPLKDVTVKRAAFGDITNAFNKSCAQTYDKDKFMAVKKVTVESKVLPTTKTIKHTTTQVNGKTSKTKQLQRAATSALESVQKHFAKDPPKPTKAQNGILKNNDKHKLSISKDSQTNSAKSDMSTEPSLYMTALESSSSESKEASSISEKLDKVVLDDTLNQSLDEETDTPHSVPEGVVDFDLENWNDPCQVSHYAMDIFNYLKSRERLFPIKDYLECMPGITSWMRALLVDWMVEVQESFELNHETLYLAVKLVDLYLTRTSSLPQSEHLSKEELQLLGAASLFIASKFDERIPPLVDDFLYICDGAYSHNQLIKMEMNILKVVDFDLGIPISYRFLRRYARCARVSMPTLTLARFVLELSLLEYSLAARSDSRLAAAALFVALRMKQLPAGGPAGGPAWGPAGGPAWGPALRHYTGYSLSDIAPLVLELNAALHKKPKDAISTVRNKYSHTIFFQVAKLPLLEDSALIS